MHGIVPLRGPHQTFDDLAASIDDEGFGYAGELVIEFDLAGAIVQDLKREASVVGPVTNVLGRRVVHTNRDNPEPSRAELLVESLDGRHLHLTRHAPCRPNIEEDDFSFVVGERDGFSRLDTRCREGRRARAGHRRALVIIPSSPVSKRQN